MAEHPAHPVFARVYARVAEISERRGAAGHRRKLLAGPRGRVIEVGAGSGAHFRHYPASVTEVLAVEPESYLRERAQHAAKDATVVVSVAHGDAAGLPDGESFDAGVVALVLCTVPDQDAALAELYRVIRPGGELRFYEHVRSHSGWESRFQRLADATLWPRRRRLPPGATRWRRSSAPGFGSRCASGSPTAPRRCCRLIRNVLGIARRP
jgi:ubiquinone/menaquinone biosynthesis C-methylase UbiE